MKTFIKLLICLLSFNNFAQTAPLEDHIWYLEKLVINGNDVFAPQGLNPHNDFNWNNQPNYFLVESCYDMLGIMSYDDVNSQFSITESSIGPNECPGILFPDMFDNTYMFDFYDFENGHPNPFSYTFTTQPNYIVLTITNANGDQAIYRNQKLAVGDKEKVVFSLYPNPTTNSFQVEIQSGEKVTSVRLFSLKGKEVFYFKEAQDSYDISALASGLYFVHIENKTGKSIQKIIKQ